MPAKITVKTNRSSALLEGLESLRGRTVRVGVMGAEGAADKKKPKRPKTKGKKGKKSKSKPPATGPATSLAVVAAAHEFGLGVPLRSWLRTPLDEMTPELRKMIARVARQVVAGELSAETALERVGMWTQGQLQKRMSAGLPVKRLSPVTIARKGSSKPLIDTGQLRSSITYQVVK